MIWDGTVDPDRIIGQARLELLQQLQRDRTPLRFILPGRDYERLTIVTGLQVSLGVTYLLLDLPRGFCDSFQDWRGRTFLVEFLGPDRLPCSFRTRSAKVSDRDLWAEVPGWIERVQRRRYFRISAPSGTKLFFVREGASHEWDVANLSQGGALATVPAGLGQRPRLRGGDALTGVSLLAVGERRRANLHIQTAVIKRIEEGPESAVEYCAIEFLETEKKESDTLRDLIYAFQREELRKRNLLTSTPGGLPNAG